MANLTPELKAQGWKPISEIVNEPENNIIMFGEFFNNEFCEYCSTTVKDVRNQPCNVTFPPFFRRLIPVTQDTIVLSREDANNLIDLIQAMQSEPANLPLTNSAKVLIAKLQQLEATDGTT